MLALKFPIVYVNVKELKFFVDLLKEEVVGEGDGYRATYSSLK